MLNQEIYTYPTAKKTIERIEKQEAFSSEVFIDELSEGLEGFLTLAAIGEVSFWLIVMIALGLTIPSLSPAGLIFIAHSLHDYRKRLRQLTDETED